METDKRYFVEGLFIIGFAIAAALFAVWLGNPGQRDDVLYRIRFPESVSGLAGGDPVKYLGVDAGTVKSIINDPDDPRLVQVDVRLRKDTPVKTDTRASLAIKGITGVVYVELIGGDKAAKSLLAQTRPDKVPEIPFQKSGLKAMLDELPKAVEKFMAIENQTKKVVADVGAVTEKVKAHQSVLPRRPSEDRSEAPKK